MSLQYEFPIIKVENCKAIGKPGATLQIAPLTLLFGYNDSGKSSFLRGIKLLRNIYFATAKTSPLMAHGGSGTIDEVIDDCLHMGAEVIHLSMAGGGCESVSVKIGCKNVVLASGAKLPSWLGQIRFSGETCSFTANASKYANLFVGFMKGNASEGSGGMSLMRTLEMLATPAAIEHPEAHLHPAWQAALGDVLIEAVQENRPIFVETHSELLLLRILRRIREGAFDPANLVVYWFENGHPIFLPVDNDGHFAVPWPHGFFEERSTELFG